MSPVYLYRCDGCGEELEKLLSLKDFQRTQECDECGKIATLVYTAHDVIGGQISDKTIDILSLPFGKQRARNFKYVKDVDKALATFNRRYSHLSKTRNT